VQTGTAMLSPGTIYRSEAVITAAVAANLQECPDCGHPAYHHTLAGCLASNGVGPICLCQIPRDDLDSIHNPQEAPE
jgi:hypothetical protein